MRRIGSMALVALWLLSSSHVSSAPRDGFAVTRVTVVDLGTLGGQESFGKDINNHGEIVGWAQTADGVRRAFLHSGGRMRGIVPALGESEANGINNLTEVVGTFYSPDQRRPGFSEPHAFEWEAGLTRRLHDTAPPHIADCRGWSYAQAINDAGAIAGTVAFAYRIDGGWPCSSGVTSGAVTWWTPAAAHSFLPLRGPSSDAYDINNRDEIAGWTFVDGDFSSRPNETFRYSGGVLSTVPPPPNPRLHYYNDGDAYGINNAGAVVGAYWVSDPVVSRQAILWDGRSPDSVGLPRFGTGSYTVATEINDDNFVSGWGYARTLVVGGVPLTFTGAFLYHSSIGMFELPGLVARLGFCEAYAINNRNVLNSLIQLTGRCTSAVGPPHAVRWDVFVKAISTPGVTP